MAIKNFEISDFVYNYISNNKKCLEISYCIENFSSKLSSIFNETYCLSLNTGSVNANDSSKENNYLEFNPQTFHNYFSENSFDLIIIYDWEKFQFDNNFLNIMDEIKKILKNTGCLLLPVSGRTQNSSMLNIKKTEEFLKNSHFQITKHWILPKLDNPLYSGNINDMQPLSWFLKNLDNFIPSFKKKGIKKKIFLKFLKVQNQKFLSLFLKLFTPSFLVCCTLNEINSYNSFILKKTRLESSIFMNRPFKLLYVLFDSHGSPKQTVSVNKSTLNLMNCQSLFQTLDNSAVYRDWVEGRIINPLNHDEVLLAISWIINFQKNHQTNPLKPLEIEEEINSLRETILSVQKLKQYSITKWIDDYEFFLKTNPIFKTSIHGDLSHKNMILGPNNTIEVIDWNFFQESGNPLDDIGNFLFRLTTKSKSDSKLDSFRNKITGRDMHFNKLRSDIENVFSKHLNIQFDYLFMIKIYLLKSIYNKILNNEDISPDLEYVSEISTKSSTNRI